MSAREQPAPNPNGRLTVRWIVVCAAAFAVTSAITGFLLLPMKDLVLTGANDFLSYYAGGLLAFHPDLYNPARIQEIQQQFAGTSSQTLPFSRLPVIAAFFWPLAQLPYASAYAIWQGMCLLATFAFLASWPLPRRAALLALSASLPLQWSFANAQDLPWMLAFVGISLLLLSNDSPGLAGMALSLSLSKYHLVVFLPLVLLSKSRRRTGSGFLIGVFALIGLSFVVAGVDWPEDYVRLLIHSKLDSDLMHPNLYGAVSQLSGHLALMVMIVALLVGALLFVAKTASEETSLAAALLCGLLVTPHIFVQDFTLLLPVCLIVLKCCTSDLSRLPALYLLTPFPYLFELALPPPAGQSITVAMSLILAGLVREQFGKSAETSGATSPTTTQ